MSEFPKLKPEADMLVIPLKSKDGKSDKLVIVLLKENIERMQKADPAQVNLNKAPALRGWSRQLVNPDILICYEEDDKALGEIVATRDIDKISEYLQRGYTFDPAKGDSEEDYKQIDPKKGLKATEYYGGESKPKPAPEG